VNDKILVKLDKVAPYMDERQHQHLMMHWESICHWVLESCEATSFALARLLQGVVQTWSGDRIAKELVEDGRSAIQTAVVQRVEGWQFGNTIDGDKLGVFLTGSP